VSVPLELHGVERRVGRDGALALDGVDLVVEAGTVHGLVGPNGAGKTTLLRLVLGLLHPTAGSVRVLGVDPCLGTPPGLAGFADAPRFYPYLTGRQNLSLLGMLDGQDADVASVLDQVGLTDRADEKTRGWSTGMRQRLGIAAALMRRPRLLVLDEPASGLDPAGAAGLHDLVRRIAVAGTTVLLSSHDMDEVDELCARVPVPRGSRSAPATMRRRPQCPGSPSCTATADS
jgi:ABC-2 type transport system ATP-binding protein